jgi:hypothetical protein
MNQKKEKNPLLHLEQGGEAVLALVPVLVVLAEVVALVLALAVVVVLALEVVLAEVVLVLVLEVVLALAVVLALVVVLHGGQHWHWWWCWNLEVLVLVLVVVLVLALVEVVVLVFEVALVAACSPLSSSFPFIVVPLHPPGSIPSPHEQWLAGWVVVLCRGGSCQRSAFGCCRCQSKEPKK